MEKTIKKFLEKCKQLNIKKSHIYLAVISMIFIAAIFFTNDLNDSYIDSYANGQETTYESDLTDNETTSEFIFVDISGAVKNPGVYKVKSDSRLFEVIKKAGGLNKEACIDNINRADFVKDGQKIVIPHKGEIQSNATTSESSNALININTSTSEELQTIKGIGPATAKKIIDYRTANGSFKKIEDLMNVNGIGEKTFEKMKNDICI